jgi:hypothetical protein
MSKDAASGDCLTALHAIATGAVPTQRASVPLLLDGFPVVAWAADAVVAGAVKAQRAAVARFLQGSAGVAALRGHAIAARAVVPQWTPSQSREGLNRLLRQHGKRREGNQEGDELLEAHVSVRAEGDRHHSGDVLVDGASVIRTRVTGFR